MRTALDLTRWPTWLLVAVGAISVAANVPPLERVSVVHLVIAGCAAFGFGLAVVTRLRSTSQDQV